MKLRENRVETARGGYGFDIKLRHRGNTAAVYWTVDIANSYVAHEGRVFSINGIGEERWRVERWNPEFEEVMDYFYKGWESANL